jgi:hypothetical protein
VNLFELSSSRDDAFDTVWKSTWKITIRRFAYNNEDRPGRLPLVVPVARIYAFRGPHGLEECVEV